MWFTVGYERSGRHAADFLAYDFLGAAQGYVCSCRVHSRAFVLARLQPPNRLGLSRGKPLTCRTDPTACIAALNRREKAARLPRFTPTPHSQTILSLNGIRSRGWIELLTPPPPPSSSPPPSFSKNASRVYRVESLTAKYFAEFNNGAFGGALSDVKVTWNNRLSRTAGITQCVRRSAPFGGSEYVSSVELSSKVLDTEPKLRETLLHELCHAAAWSIDHISKPPHGAHFWAWARRAKEAHPGVPITTCHSYEINFKYRYVCVGASPGEDGSEHQRRGCGVEIGRHSKSINVDKQVCGQCKGRLRLLGTYGKDGKLKKPRAASGFSQFFKDNYAEVKGKLPPGTPQQRVMKEVSRRWAARDQSVRSCNDPDSIVDGLRALSLQSSPLPPPAVNACSGMKPDGGRKAGGCTGGLRGVGSGDKENSPGGVVDLT